MRSSVPKGTDDPMERLQPEADSKVNEEQEPRGIPSASIQAEPVMLQGHQVMYGETVTPDHSQQAANVALANLTSGVHFPPIAVESSNLQAIQSLTPEQQMTLFHPNHYSAIMNIPPGQNLAAFGEQPIIPSQIANLPEQSHPSNPMGMESHGYVLDANYEVIQNFGNAYGAANPYPLPLSTLPPEHRLDSSSSVQLPQIPQQGPQTTLNSRNDGGFGRAEWTNWPPQSQTATGTQGIHFRGLLNQDGSVVPSNFYPGTGSSSRAPIPNMPIQQEMVPYGSGSTLIPHSFEVVPPNISNSKRGNQGNVGNYGQFEAGGSSQRSPRRKVTWKGQDNNNLKPSQGHQLGTRAQTSR
ncbi:hypothetical protein TIFTF001_001148 [Ficus carica]|uniref:Uncharacterized protein n=1 Tax=Ficus carica TaxID=3494 RepID=A0AA87Z090_FICCA|nr:hypothetical protein TIFTF001_001148 [Ficus carica]